MHSPRKVYLGRRNGLAMLDLMGAATAGFAPFGATGPVLESAVITTTQQGSNIDSGGASYNVTITFNAKTAQKLHFAGAADCAVCCRARPFQVEDFSFLVTTQITRQLLSFSLHSQHMRRS